jgi:hypothetical protein
LLLLLLPLLLLLLSACEGGLSYCAARRHRDLASAEACVHLFVDVTLINRVEKTHVKADGELVALVARAIRFPKSAGWVGE